MKFFLWHKKYYCYYYFRFVQFHTFSASTINTVYRQYSEMFKPKTCEIIAFSGFLFSFWVEKISWNWFQEIFALSTGACRDYISTLVNNIFVGLDSFFKNFWSVKNKYFVKLHNFRNSTSIWSKKQLVFSSSEDGPHIFAPPRLRSIGKVINNPSLLHPSLG